VEGVVLSWSPSFGGSHHVNPQSQAYVVCAMGILGFEPDMAAQESLRRLVPKINPKWSWRRHEQSWKDECPWFRDTLMVFRRNSSNASGAASGITIHVPRLPTARFSTAYYQSVRQHCIRVEHSNGTHTAASMRGGQASGPKNTEAADKTSKRLGLSTAGPAYKSVDVATPMGATQHRRSEEQSQMPSAHGHVDRVGDILTAMLGLNSKNLRAVQRELASYLRSGILTTEVTAALRADPHSLPQQQALGGSTTSWLQLAFVRFHGLLFRMGLLPISEWGEGRGSGDFDESCIGRLGFVDGFSSLRVLAQVPEGAECMGWHRSKKQPGGYPSLLVPGCVKDKVWVFRYKENEPLTLVDKTRVAYGDLTLYKTFRGKLQLDVIVCNQVFEHVRQPFHAAIAMYHMLRPGGYIFWSAPFLERTHGVPYDFFRFTAGAAQAILTDAGFEIRAMRKVGDSQVTSGYVMGFGSGDFGSKQQVLARPLVDELNRSTESVPSQHLYISTLVLAQRPLERRSEGSPLPHNVGNEVSRSKSDAQAISKTAGTSSTPKSCVPQKPLEQPESHKALAVVIGVFSEPGGAALRSYIRRQTAPFFQPLLVPSEGAHVRHVVDREFVICTADLELSVSSHKASLLASLKREASLEGDLFLLENTSNIRGVSTRATVRCGVNIGTLEYFEAVAQRQKRYDWVFKSDTDDFVVPHNLLLQLVKLPRRDGYFGQLCAAQDGQFIDDFDSFVPEWMMCGALYGLTWDLITSTKLWSSVPQHQLNKIRFNADRLGFNNGRWGHIQGQEDSRTRFFLHLAGLGRQAYILRDSHWEILDTLRRQAARSACGQHHDRFEPKFQRDCLALNATFAGRLDVLVHIHHVKSLALWEALMSVFSKRAAIIQQRALVQLASTSQEMSSDCESCALPMHARAVNDTASSRIRARTVSDLRALQHFVKHST